MKELKVLEENVLAAAEKYAIAKEVLKQLFPDTFKPKVLIGAGDIVQWDGSEICAIIPYGYSTSYKEQKYFTVGLSWSPTLPKEVAPFSNPPRTLEQLQESFYKNNGKVIGKVKWEMF